MIAPNEVNILGLVYEVKRETLVDMDGYISPKTQTICIDPELSETKAHQVFIHEVIHGVLDQLGYDELYENEQLVQGLAVGIHQALFSSDA